jgi:hypothetical protein
MWLIYYFCFEKKAKNPLKSQKNSLFFLFHYFGGKIKQINHQVAKIHQIIFSKILLTKPLLNHAMKALVVLLKKMN